jgi:hypothetical protein
MKPQEEKTEFIKLRAEGKSYGFIADALHISKSTCTSWERELKDQIAQLKREQLNELYDSYYMTREARIKKLGDTLLNINTALDNSDLSAVSPEKLLDFKLKYTEALKAEYIDINPPRRLGTNFKAQDILMALGNLLDRIRAGEVSMEQAGRESLVIGNILKSYDTVALQTKLQELEAVIGGRD